MYVCGFDFFHVKQYSLVFIKSKTLHLLDTNTCFIFEIHKIFVNRAFN